MPLGIFPSENRIHITRSDGSTALDTATRMPAKLGSISLTGVTVEFPIIPGETNTYLPSNGWWRHTTPSSNIVTQQTLAAYPSSVPPQFFWCRARFTWNTVGNIGGRPITPNIMTGEWVPWVGSVFLESYQAYLFRHLNIVVTGGNIVLEKRQSTEYKTTDFNIQGSTHSVYAMDLELAWGIFDA